MVSFCQRIVVLPVFVKQGADRLDEHDSKKFMGVVCETAGNMPMFEDLQLLHLGLVAPDKPCRDAIACYALVLKERNGYEDCTGKVVELRKSIKVNDPTRLPASKPRCDLTRLMWFSLRYCVKNMAASVAHWLGTHMPSGEGKQYVH